MLQNTYGNKGLDTLFGPGRIPDFWTPIVKNIHVFVHPIKKPSQAQGFWTYIHASGCLLVRSFRKHNTQLASLSWPKPVCLWWFLHFQARCMYVCMHACRHLEAQKIKFRPGSPECFKTLTPRRLNIRRYFVFVAENPNQGMSVWGFRYEVSRLSWSLY